MSKELDDFVAATAHLDIRLGETLTERSERLCRARAIRSVVAAQWLVACELMHHLDDEGETDAERLALRDWTEGVVAVAAVIANLPTPEQIVDGDFE